MSLITSENASFAYDNNVVCQNLNFKVDDGDYLCVIGSNGSGKSTLIKGLLRQKKPFEGNIIFNKNLQANTIGYLPQLQIVNGSFPASVYEVVISGRLNQLSKRFFYNSKDKAAALENMDRLGITHLAKRNFSELSGGQRQRVLLARALCSTKKLLILDEPVTGLDPHATNELYLLIQEINNSGIGIIMVSHDTAKIFDCAKHILHLNNKQLFYGTTEEYLNSEYSDIYLKLGGHND